MWYLSALIYFTPNRDSESSLFAHPLHLPHFTHPIPNTQHTPSHTSACPSHKHLSPTTHIIHVPQTPLLAYILAPNPPCFHTMPSPRSESYRNQVQTRIIDLVSGKRPRDPHLSTLSTQRLILEGIVEEIRIYRLGKEEKKRKEKDKKKREKRRMTGHDRERSRSEERRRRRHEGSGRRRHHDRSGERDHAHLRHRSRDRSRDRRRHGRPDRGISDIVTEGRADPNPDLMMTGGAGPAGTLPLTPPFPHPPPPPPLPHHPNPGKVGVSPSPTRRHGPDGKTPFGQLPKKAAGVGFAAHALNTYKHIKAEHEAGHRSRGILERTVDGWRGKRPNTAAVGGGSDGKGRESEKLKKDDRWRRAEEKGRRDDRGRDEGRVDRGRRKHRDHHKNDRRKGDPGSRRSGGVDARSDRASRDVEREFDQPVRRNQQYVYDYTRAPDEDTPPKSFLPHLTGPSDTNLPFRPPPGRPPHAANDHPRATVTDTPIMSGPSHHPPPGEAHLTHRPPPEAPPRTAYDDLYAQPSPAQSVHPRAAAPLEHTNTPCPSSPQAQPHISHDALYANPSATPSVHVQEATPPSFHQDEAPAWAPTPESFMPRAHTPSRERFESRLAA